MNREIECHLGCGHVSLTPVLSIMHLLDGCPTGANVRSEDPIFTTAHMDQLRSFSKDDLRDIADYLNSEAIAYGRKAGKSPKVRAMLGRLGALQSRLFAARNEG